MEAQDLQIEEVDIRELVARLVESGEPQSLDTLTEWYVEVLVRRATGR